MSADLVVNDIGMSDRWPEGSIHSVEVREFSDKLRSVSAQARKLLAHIAELAYHGRGQQRKPDVAYLPELHESCGLDVEAMYSLLNELQQARLIQLEDPYPFEDVKILPSSAGWNVLEALAKFSETEKLPLREVLVNFRAVS
ncbi:MAG TPA: hypothetical protein VFU50_03580 [Terriglobales bacterium]|nr:hypothetical protein [Terriglobales bacterium]